MKKAMYGLLVAAVAAISAPASASTDNAALDNLYDAGRCIVARDRGTAVNLLQTVPIDGDVADLSRVSGAAANCLDGLSSAEPLHLRGAIAQAMFFRDFGGFGLEPRRSAPLVNIAIPTQDSPGTTRSERLYSWADCVVRNDATRTETLLESDIGSRAEGAAVERLRSFMAACAGEGSQITVQPAELRSLLAQSAYNSMYRYWTDQLRPVRDQ